MNCVKKHVAHAPFSVPVIYLVIYKIPYINLCMIHVQIIVVLGVLKVSAFDKQQSKSHLFDFQFFCFE